MVDDIKENGYVRWKGFLTTMGVALFSVFIYLHSSMVSKGEFDQFEKRVIESLDDIKKDLRAKK